MWEMKWAFATYRDWAFVSQQIKKSKNQLPQTHAFFEYFQRQRYIRLHTNECDPTLFGLRECGHSEPSFVAPTSSKQGNKLVHVHVLFNPSRSRALLKRSHGVTAKHLLVKPVSPVLDEVPASCSRLPHRPMSLRVRSLWPLLLLCQHNR